MDVKDVDVLAVKPAEDVAADNRVGRTTRDAAGGDVNDPVHHGDQSVHLVRGQQHGDCLLAREAGEQRDDLLPARIEIGERLVEQEQAGPPTSACAIRIRCCSPPESRPTRAPAKSSAPTARDRVDPLAAPARRERDPEPVGVESERDQIPGPQRNVGVEQELLRHIADITVGATAAFE